VTDKKSSKKDVEVLNGVEGRKEEGIFDLIFATQELTRMDYLFST
jgi:hypothetical protein